MAKQKINDELLDYVNGASDMEIQELKAAILSNPELRDEWYNVAKEEDPYDEYEVDDREMIQHIITTYFSMSVIDLNKGSKPNAYVTGGHKDSLRKLTHAEVLQMIKNY
jgi:hypothetical protein